MSELGERPSKLLKLGFRVPVWMYKAHLGAVFGGRIIAVVYHGRKSQKRYVSGLEVVIRRDGELFVVSGYGTRAGWYRNIEAGGVGELWDGRERYGHVGFRRVEPDEVYEVLADYEREHPETARTMLPRMQEGYDFSDEARERLAGSAVMVAFKPA